MLTITLLGDEHYDNESEKFIRFGDVEVHLEHSLVSISKWESKYQKPFISDKEKSSEEILFYVECMVTDKDFPLEKLSRINEDNITEILEYIKSPQTATTVHMPSTKNNKKEVVTSELVYYWMVAAEIDWEAQHWHLNRLITLIQIFQVKNNPKKGKMSKSEMLQQRRELNAQRRAENGSKG